MEKVNTLGDAHRDALLTAILKEFKGLREDLSKASLEIDNKLTALSDTVHDLSTEFKLCEPLFVKAADAYDILKRREMRELHGPSFVERD